MTVAATASRESGKLGGNIQRMPVPLVEGRRAAVSPSLNNSECWHFVCMCIYKVYKNALIEAYRSVIFLADYEDRAYCKLLNL